MIQKLPMFKDFIKIADNTDRLYAGLGVDDNTINAIADYMALMRIGNVPERFIWLYRRSLMRAYPVYKDQMEAWAERKSKSWFFDNLGSHKVTHDGTFGLDESTINQIETATTQIVKNLTKSSYEDTNNTESAGSTDRDSKDRMFAFAYPETNYQGGVVPYDMDNDPSVEFISQQTDRLNRFAETRSDESQSDASGNTTNNFDGDTKGSLKTETSNAVDQDTITHWTETRDATAVPYNQLMAELIRDLPNTDFFAQFVGYLSVCFEVVHTTDDYYEEIGGGDYYEF